MTTFLPVAALAAVALLGFGMVETAQAQPAFTSSLTNWGRISIYGPQVTTSGGARTELTGVVDRWDRGGVGDGWLEQSVWTEAAHVGGTPTFRSYHALEGHGIPFHQGKGWTGFSTNTTYRDVWTLSVPGMPIGNSVPFALGFSLHGVIKNLFPPGGSIALPPDFYPYNPLWGAAPGNPPVVGPLPKAPDMRMRLELGSYEWLGVERVDGPGTHHVVLGATPGFFPSRLMVKNGMPFTITLGFEAGWRMEHSDILSILGPSFDQFSTNRVWDASQTARLSLVEVLDSNGAPLSNWSLIDSSGAAIAAVAVPEPGTGALLTVGAGLLWVRSRRHQVRQRIQVDG